jgi:ABC-type Fe3+-citrate transport system substrate-binding protein
MNENYTGDNSPTTDSESVNINQLVSRVEELEQRADRQQETIEDQQETIDNQQDEVRTEVSRDTQRRESTSGVLRRRF